MMRALLGGLIVALIAIAIGWQWYANERAAQEHQAAQISDLAAQVSKVSAENERLKSELAKVQDEEARLTRDNDALRKAIEQAKLTGKVPEATTALPYPPK
jgi:regulator of replication initiation timing